MLNPTQALILSIGGQLRGELEQLIREYLTLTGKLTTFEIKQLADMIACHAKEYYRIECNVIKHRPEDNRTTFERMFLHLFDTIDWIAYGYDFTLTYCENNKLIEFD